MADTRQVVSFQAFDKVYGLPHRRPQAHVVDRYEFQVQTGHGARIAGLITRLL